MPLPSKPFDQWQKDDLAALLDDPPAVETARLDFKVDCNLLSSNNSMKEKSRRDILIDVAAMANGSGGILILGVRQSGKPGDLPFADKIVGMEDPERLKQSIEGLVNTHLDVRPAPLRYHTVPYENARAVLIVEVPTNTYSLSMVTYDRLNQFWIRRETDNRLMTTDEIEYELGQFAKVRDSTSEEMARIRQEFSQGSNQRMVWFAGVPIARSRDHIPVDIAEMKRLIGDSSYFTNFPGRRGMGCQTPDRFASELSPSLRGMQLSAYTVPAILEIRRDGVVVFACDLSGDEVRIDKINGKYILTASQIYEPILSGLHLLADIQDRFSLSRIYLVQAGLLGVQHFILSNAGRPAPFPDGLEFQEGEIPLDAILTDEHWTPRTVFQEWSRQIGNALSLEHPYPASPWTDDLT